MRIELGLHVAVDVERDSGSRVPESLADDLRMDTGLQCQRCPRMAKVVQTNGLDSGATCRRRERTREPVRMQRLADLAAEHEVVVLPELAGGQSFLELSTPMRTQHGDRLGIQGEGPTRPRGLRRSPD